MKISNIQKVILLLASALPWVAMNVHAEPATYKMAYVGDRENSAFLGASQGLDEANLQGQFLNRQYTLTPVATAKALSADYGDYIAVVAAVDHDTYLKLVAKLPQVPVFNVTLDDDDLRAACLPNALHVYPSHSMKADAVAQWLQAHPEARVTAQTWHPDFVKFAARDLNKRYSKSHDTPMDDAAWAGWAAVRMSADAILRENIATPDQLLAYLKTDLLFDGQMGIEMNFRKTGQLRQPLLLIEDGKIAGEAPVRGVSNDIDSLGNIGCTK